MERDDSRIRDGALVTRLNYASASSSMRLAQGFIVVLLLMIIRSHLGTAHQCSRPLSEIGPELPDREGLGFNLRAEHRV